MGARPRDEVATPGKDVLVRRAALLTMLALAIATTACGGADQSASPPTGAATTSTSAQQAVLQAATRGAELESARISFTATIDAGVVSGTFTGEGAFSGQKARMVLDMGEFTNGQMSGTTEAVFDDLVMYMRFPAPISNAFGLPAGKQWIKFDLAELGKDQGIDFGALFNQFSGSDPSRSLELLRAAQADLREIGEEDVRGAETTHYRGTVDLKRLAETAPADVRESYRRLLELSAQARIPVDVWIDGDGRTRRIRYEQEMSDGSSMDLTQEYYDFGADVNVESPPPSEVADFSELLGSAA
jgi:hypothetical protein